MAFITGLDHLMHTLMNMHARHNFPRQNSSLQPMCGKADSRSRTDRSRPCKAQKTPPTRPFHTFPRHAAHSHETYPLTVNLPLDDTTTLGAITIGTDLAMDPCDDRQKSERTAALKRYQILDDEPEPVFDHVTRLAASLFDAPFAALTFAADGCVWSKSVVGLTSPEHAEMSGFFDQATENRETLIAKDATTDRRLTNDPSAASTPHVGFYAGTPLMTPNGQHIGTLGIADTRPRSTFSATDTQRLQDLAALVIEQLEFRLKHSDSAHTTEKSSAFFAAMSHEIRTPMNGVLGMAELLLIADDLSDRHRRRVEIIKRSGETLLSMLDHIIELSKIETEETPPNSSPFDLLELVHDVHAQLQRKDIGRTIEIEAAKSQTNVVGDAARFKKLLSNFLNSAINFSKEEAIRLVTAIQPAANGIVQVRFEIDNAHIDAGTIERILAAFERDGLNTSESFSEAALGLIICKRLSTMMGGDVGLNQVAGTTPILWLEISLDAQSETAEADETPTAHVGKGPDHVMRMGRDVLVAEDNPDMALLIEDLLEEAGYQATMAPDGASVLKILDEQHIDIVLMDGRMPDMSGFETTDLIRKLPDERANVPIIALTAEALAGDRERYLSAGMDDYVAKPVDYETLIGAIERCCGEQRRTT